MAFHAAFQPFMPSDITDTFVHPLFAARPAASCEAVHIRLVQ